MASGGSITWSGLEPQRIQSNKKWPIKSFDNDSGLIVGEIFQSAFDQVGKVGDMGGADGLAGEFKAA